MNSQLIHVIALLLYWDVAPSHYLTLVDQEQKCHRALLDCKELNFNLFLICIKHQSTKYKRRTQFNAQGQLQLCVGYNFISCIALMIKQFYYLDVPQPSLY